MTEGVSFLDLAPGACHYPLGQRDEPPTTFCGEPALPGRPYCACHHRIAYTTHRRAQPQDRQIQAIAMIEADDRAKPVTGRACLSVAGS